MKPYIVILGSNSYDVFMHGALFKRSNEPRGCAAVMNKETGDLIRVYITYEDRNQETCRRIARRLCKELGDAYEAINDVDINNIYIEK